MALVKLIYALKKSQLLHYYSLYTLKSTLLNTINALLPLLSIIISLFKVACQSTSISLLAYLIPQLWSYTLNYQLYCRNRYLKMQRLQLFSSTKCSIIQHQRSPLYLISGPRLTIQPFQVLKPTLLIIKGGFKTSLLPFVLSLGFILVLILL